MTIDQEMVKTYVPISIMASGVDVAIISHELKTRQIVSLTALYSLYDNKIKEQKKRAIMFELKKPFFQAFWESFGRG